MIFLKGKPIADKIVNTIYTKIQKYNLSPQLISLTIGKISDSNLSYLKQQKETAKRSGISLTCVQKNIKEDIPFYINQLNDNPNIHGIILQRPVTQPWNAEILQEMIHINKDVEATNPLSLGKIIYNQADLFPCAAQAAFLLIQEIESNLTGMTASVVGQSTIVGKPLSLLLGNAGVTVTSCHEHTKNLKKITCESDIICTAVGKPGLITSDMIKKGAIVIDIGINILKNGTIVGDAAIDVIEKCRAYTPVPGGVGPLTTAILLENTFKTFCKQNKLLY